MVPSTEGQRSQFFAYENQAKRLASVAFTDVIINLLVFVSFRNPEYFFSVRDIFWKLRTNN